MGLASSLSNYCLQLLTLEPETCPHKPWRSGRGLGRSQEGTGGREGDRAGGDGPEATAVIDE